MIYGIDIFSDCTEVNTKLCHLSLEYQSVGGNLSFKVI